MLFNLDFANNTILSCFFFFSLTSDLHFLIPAATAQIFLLQNYFRTIAEYIKLNTLNNPIAELVIPLGIRSKDGKAEIEIHSVIVEAKIRTCCI